MPTARFKIVTTKQPNNQTTEELIRECLDVRRRSEEMRRASEMVMAASNSLRDQWRDFLAGRAPQNQPIHE